MVEMALERGLWNFNCFLSSGAWLVADGDFPFSAASGYLVISQYFAYKSFLAVRSPEAWHEAEVFARIGILAALVWLAAAKFFHSATYFCFTYTAEGLALAIKIFAGGFKWWWRIDFKNIEKRGWRRRNTYGREY